MPGSLTARRSSADLLCFRLADDIRPSRPTDRRRD